MRVTKDKILVKDAPKATSIILVREQVAEPKWYELVEKGEEVRELVTSDLVYIRPQYILAKVAGFSVSTSAAVLLVKNKEQ